MTEDAARNRAARLARLYEDIANGNGPLDRIERFCRERKIYDFCNFIKAAGEEAPDLAKWAVKPGRGTGARMRGISARIAKVRREADGKGDADAG